MATNFKTTQNLVIKILQEIPETRGSDSLLIYHVISNYVDVNKSISYLFENRNDLKIPSFETIRRVRQKIQSKHPELASEKARKLRHQLEEDYKDYSKE